MNCAVKYDYWCGEIWHTWVMAIGHQLLHDYITGHQLLHNDYITDRMSHPGSWVPTSHITGIYKVSAVIGLYNDAISSSVASENVKQEESMTLFIYSFLITKEDKWKKLIRSFSMWRSFHWIIIGFTMNWSMYQNGLVSMVTQAMVHNHWVHRVS